VLCAYLTSLRLKLSAPIFRKRFCDYSGSWVWSGREGAARRLSLDRSVEGLAGRAYPRAAQQLGNATIGAP